MPMFEHLKGKKLYRSPNDAVIFGIASGLAKYLQVDLVFIRLIIIALAFITDGWPILFAYVVGVFIIPIDPAQDTVAPEQSPKDVTQEAGESESAQSPEEEKEHEKKSDERMDSDQNV